MHSKRRPRSLSWRPDVQPVAVNVGSDDEWLERVCTELKNPKHWSITQHHRARMEYIATVPRAGWTDGTRRLAWNAVLQYAYICEENNIAVRPMPPHISTATIEKPHCSEVIGTNGTHFICRPDVSASYAIISLRSAGLCWKQKLTCYAARISPESVAAVRKLVDEYGFSLSPSAEEAIAAAQEESRELYEASRSVDGSGAIDGVKLPLHPYQIAGVHYLCKTRRAFLADDMGLGKTAQALATVHRLNAWPAVVVTMASVKDGWRTECAKWLDGVQVRTWVGKTGPCEVSFDTDPEAPRILHVINYDILPARLEELKETSPQAIIVDESHTVKNGKSKRSKAVKELCKRRPVRLLLSGTPVENRPKEVLTQLSLMGRLDDFGGFESFTRRYLDRKQTKYGWNFSGARNLGELHEKMRSICFLRRTKDQVQTDLPDTVITRVPVEMSPDGRALYNAVQKDVKAWISERAAVKPEFLRSIAHLPEDVQAFEKARKVAEMIERIDGMELLHQFSELRHAAIKAKLPAIADWIRHHCEAQKLVLFGNFVAAVRGLVPMLEGCSPLVIDGQTPVPKRPLIVEAFNREDDRRVILCNYKAAGTGLNGLQTAAHHFVAGEWPWTPYALRQAVSRLHRQGQKSTVFQWHLVCPGTVDDESLDLLNEKAMTCDQLIDGTESTRKTEAFTRARKAAAGMMNASDQEREHKTL